MHKEIIDLVENEKKKLKKRNEKKKDKDIANTFN